MLSPTASLPEIREGVPGSIRRGDLRPLWGMRKEEGEDCLKGRETAVPFRGSGWLTIPSWLYPRCPRQQQT